LGVFFIYGFFKLFKLRRDILIASERQKKDFIRHYKFDFRMIKVIRQMRNMTQVQWSELMGIANTTLSDLEKGKHEFSPFYYEKMKFAMQKVNFSTYELETAKKLARYKHIKDELEKGDMKC